MSDARQDEVESFPRHSECSLKLLVWRKMTTPSWTCRCFFVVSSRICCISGSWQYLHGTLPRWDSVNRRSKVVFSLQLNSSMEFAFAFCSWIFQSFFEAERLSFVLCYCFAWPPPCLTCWMLRFMANYMFVSMLTEWALFPTTKY